MFVNYCNFGSYQQHEIQQKKELQIWLRYTVWNGEIMIFYNNNSVRRNDFFEKQFRQENNEADTME
jgi:hypothetical protein